MQHSIAIIQYSYCTATVEYSYYAGEYSYYTVQLLYSYYTVEYSYYTVEYSYYTVQLLYSYSIAIMFTRPVLPFPFFPSYLYHSFLSFFPFCSFLKAPEFLEYADRLVAFLAMHYEAQWTHDPRFETRRLRKDAESQKEATEHLQKSMVILSKQNVQLEANNQGRHEELMRVCRMGGGGSSSLEEGSTYVPSTFVPLPAMPTTFVAGLVPPSAAPASMAARESTPAGCGAGSSNVDASAAEAAWRAGLDPVKMEVEKNVEAAVASYESKWRAVEAHFGPEGTVQTAHPAWLPHLKKGVTVAPANVRRIVFSAKKPVADNDATYRVYSWRAPGRLYYDPTKQGLVPCNQSHQAWSKQKNIFAAVDKGATAATIAASFSCFVWSLRERAGFKKSPDDGNATAEESEDAYELASKLLALYMPEWRRTAAREDKEALKAVLAEGSCLPPTPMMTGLLAMAGEGRVPPGRRAVEAVDAFLSQMHGASRGTLLNRRKNAAYVFLFGPGFNAADGQLHETLVPPTAI